MSAANNVRAKAVLHGHQPALESAVMKNANHPAPPLAPWLAPLLVSTLAAGLVIGSMFDAAACPIPVCQFSLEYWESDHYQVEVRHDGTFSEDQQAALDLLEAAAAGRGRHANVTLSWRDYSKALIAPPQGVELPYVRVTYPTMSGIRAPFWEGPLEKQLIEDRLLHSPKRQEIAEKLLDRRTGVWLLLESGNRSNDRTARRTLERELPRLEQTLTFPDLGDADWGEIANKVEFSFLTLRRDDPDEQVLVNMLLGIERDLKDYEDKPIVFPIYGRGLIMYALIGDGINAWTLARAGQFLTGPTSGEVKNQNPGVDMLMSVDWESKVERRSIYDAHGAHASGFLDRMEEAGARLRMHR
jgi:hypothetical protein